MVVVVSWGGEVLVLFLSPFLQPLLGLSLTASVLLPLCVPLLCMCLQVREVWLSSEDTGAYGRDIGTSLPALLTACVAVLPPDGRTMLRVGMTNPPFILEHLDAIAEVGVYCVLLGVCGQIAG